MLVGTYKVTRLKSCGAEEGKPRNPDQVDGAPCVGLITNNSQLVRAVQSGMGCLRKQRAPHHSESGVNIWHQHYRKMYDGWAIWSWVHYDLWDLWILSGRKFLSSSVGFLDVFCVCFLRGGGTGNTGPLVMCMWELRKLADNCLGGTCMTGDRQCYKNKVLKDWGPFPSCLHFESCPKGLSVDRFFLLVPLILSTLCSPIS